MKSISFALITSLLILSSLIIGCAPAQVNLFPRHTDPLREQVLEGHHSDKVLVIPVQGFISSTPQEGLFTDKPSMVQEVVAHLNKARGDSNIRALVLLIDSPGGTSVDSDILYHEIRRFRQQTNVPVVAVMLGVAASGGYYISLPADVIIAHPGTITGSVGTIFVRPKIHELLDKIGVEAKVTVSGNHKDIGSPFRPDSGEEEAILQSMVDELNSQFVRRVIRHREPSEEALETISSGRVFTARQAKELAMIDEIGYLPDALKLAKLMGEANPAARVVAYRRSLHSNDNLYNTMTNRSSSFPLVVKTLPRNLAPQSPGFYHLWIPSV
ncbi:signal peptide peptidase SppA [Desulfurispira natronophila]|uniref:Protease-4 n=1 Tax=Desulfurispira natronophila TaxID=682562 RepID=A0A7W8DG81_9BACT|nr:signal peptide peptidase SppA [Desulfurispira natronophila]MBB5020943.1 protease-4 [Desulfurispira natronophila]